ncbi:MAG: GspMb/PilO family protein [Dehalococcoidales bacterium]|nr:GspMb/PilO family protein [Dehalococcoidales bacterium]
MKAKINKRLWLMMATGVFLVALTALGAAYLGQIREQKRLAAEIADTKAQTRAISVTNIESQRSSVNVTLLKYSTDIQNTTAQLTVPLVATDIFHQLLTIADNVGVHVSVIGSSVQSRSVISGIPYQTISLDLSVKGTEQDLYGFVDSVSKSIPTGVIQNINIRISNAASTAGAEMTTKLTIYSYRGE